ncbi:MAG: hypothetical protein HYR95_01895 [Candidatus Colwellbacteria bacterium]|nr:hypothetical protein [Candidatus Colwellbacteria bacterium]MBI3273894.1 hypothetical protein [Candidatus Colwellbacteria bacterium]
MNCNGIPFGFPIRTIVKEVEVVSELEFMSDFWHAASEAYKELQAWQPVDMTQDELVISYRKMGPTSVHVRVSISTMS